MSQSEPATTDMDLGAALAELDSCNPKATKVVRAYLDQRRQHEPLDRLIATAVDPVWRAAVDAVEELNQVKLRDAAIAERGIASNEAIAKAYSERTALWKDVVLPKVMPAIGALLVVFVTWIAMMLGVQTPVVGGT